MNTSPDPHFADKLSTIASADELAAFRAGIEARGITGTEVSAILERQRAIERVSAHRKRKRS